MQHWVLQFSRTLVDELEILRESVAAVDPEAADNLDFGDAPNIAGLRIRYLAILEKWHATFLPLYRRARAAKRIDEHAYNKSVYLLQQFHISWIRVRALCFTEYSTIYALTPRFLEVVHLGAELLRDPTAHKQLS